MICNFSGGRIYKGSNCEVTLPMVPSCVTADTDNLVVKFYTEDSDHSVEFSVSAGTLTLDGNEGTVVFQPVQLDVLADGLLRYETTIEDFYVREWESRYMIVTPADYTPVDYVTTDTVQGVVEGMMTGYTTSAQVESIVTAATSGLVSTTDLETTLQDYAKVTDIPDVSGFATIADIQSATADMVTSSTITNIWVGTQTQYDQILSKDNATLYIIK